MGKFWLVTWTTYGSWLPGDPRGFRTWRGHEYVSPPKRYAPDDRSYDAHQYAARYEKAKLDVPHAVRLTKDEMKSSLDAIVEEITQLPLVPLILAVGNEHAHLISQFGALFIRPTVGRLKSDAVDPESR